MRIAILGATSEIAKDLVLSFSVQTSYELILLARRRDAVVHWLASAGLLSRYTVADFDTFGVGMDFDAILNFVGIGNPENVKAMSGAIFDVTLKYDEMVLDYMRQHPNCRYIFLSSGAAYGSSFDEPVDENTKAMVTINNHQSQDWYAVAKLLTECRHRSKSDLPIVDIRVFNYFSHTQDISARFFITDIMRAIQYQETLMTSPDNIVRDYIGPDDFYKLVSVILASPARNDVVDCYTKAPVDKFTMLSAMRALFGLEYEVSTMPSEMNATGTKMNYFSNNRRAETFGYFPSKKSLDCVMDEAWLLVHGYDRN
ncbi:MAG: NAD(P)-dependent oxidoreductase [Sterolibacterium sp.]